MNKNTAGLERAPRQLLFRVTSRSGFKWLSRCLLCHTMRARSCISCCWSSVSLSVKWMFPLSHPLLEAPTETYTQRFLSGLLRLPFGTGEVLVVDLYWPVWYFQGFTEEASNTQRETHMAACRCIRKQVVRPVHIALSTTPLTLKAVDRQEDR